MDSNFKTFSATDSISKGFTIAGVNWGLNIAFLLIFGIISIIIGMIPLVGDAYNYLIAPILGFGFAIVAKKYVSGQDVKLGDYFKSFDQFTPLLLTNLLKLLFSLLAALPLLYYFYSTLGGIEGIMNIGQLFKSNQNDPEAVKEQFMEIFSSLNFMLIAILGFVAAIPSILLMFSFFFVWYKKSSPTDALKQSFNLVLDNLGQVLILCILLAIISIFAAIPCGIGLLFVIPAAAYATYAAFESCVDLDDDFSKNV